MKNDEVSDARDRNQHLDGVMRRAEEAGGSREGVLEAGLLAMVYEARELVRELRYVPLREKVREAERPAPERIRREMLRQVETATEAGDPSTAHGFLAAIRALDAMTSEATSEGP